MAAAEDGNKVTAKIYDKLGLAVFAATAGFVGWDGGK